MLNYWNYIIVIKHLTSYQFSFYGLNSFYQLDTYIQYLYNSKFIIITICHTILFKGSVKMLV